MVKVCVTVHSCTSCQLLLYGVWDSIGDPFYAVANLYRGKWGALSPSPFFLAHDTLGIAIKFSKCTLVLIFLRGKSALCLNLRQQFKTTKI